MGIKGLSVFFDLETSSTLPLGQILNYSFTAVDSNWKIFKQLEGGVQISSLELPQAGAVLANRTNVLEHQLRYPDSERIAADAIGSFLSELVAENAPDKLPLIGFNSCRFDLPFLRTTFVRNGLNPYFNGRLEYRDLLLLVRKLAATERDFPRPSDEESHKLSLRLEKVAAALGVANGPQTHFSSDDVQLTIDTAREIERRFGVDVRSFQHYEAGSLRQRGELAWQLSPDYDHSAADLAQRQAMLLLDADHRSALWVDLRAYEAGQGRDSLRYYATASRDFFLGAGRPADKWLEVAERAEQDFAKVTLKNYFQRSQCDIEQDIYRLDFDAQDALAAAIRQGDQRALKRQKWRDARVIYLRYLLRNHQWGQGRDERAAEMLAAYAKYRYGGQASISKGERDPSKTEYHPTLKQLMGQIEELSRCANPADSEILTALRRFYQDSKIYQLVGRELLE